VGTANIVLHNNIIPVFVNVESDTIKNNKMLKLKKRIKYLLRKTGYDIIKYSPESHPQARLKQLIDKYNINVILDVGGNKGQFGSLLRYIGYSGRIVSFEPIREVFNVLSKESNTDDKWNALNLALGNSEGTSEINISQNSYSSSILDMLPAHVSAAEDSVYIGTENIKIKTLDSIFSTICSQDDNIYLKIDTQGYEKYVLEGAADSLRYISLLQIESSLISLYENELLFVDMYKLLYRQGFKIASIEPCFVDKTSGEVLQVEAIYCRTL